MKRTTKKTIKGLFTQMFNGLSLAELYEVERAVSDLIDRKEEKRNPRKQTDRMIELIED